MTYTAEDSLKQIAKVLMSDEDIAARYTFHPSECVFDPRLGAHEASLHEKLDNGEIDPRPTLVITVAPSRLSHVFGPPEKEELPTDYQEALAQMNDEGEPLDDEHDSVRWRVLWLLARVHSTQGRADCGLPHHHLLRHSPYHDEAAILLTDCHEIATFRFYD